MLSRSEFDLPHARYAAQAHAAQRLLQADLMRRIVITSVVASFLALLHSGISDAVVPLRIKPAHIGRATSMSVSFIQPRRLPAGYHFAFGFLTATNTDQHVSAGDCTAIKLVKSARRGAPHKRFYMPLRPLARFDNKVTTRWCTGPATISVSVFRNGASGPTYVVGSTQINVNLPSF
jgi:hypothetical protein